MTYEDFKDLNSRTTADKVLCVKTFNTAKNKKSDGYQCGLASVVFNFFDKKTLGGAIKKETMQNEELAKNYANQLLENLSKEKYIHRLQTIFAMLVLQICN